MENIDIITNENKDIIRRVIDSSLDNCFDEIHDGVVHDWAYDLGMDENEVDLLVANFEDRVREAEEAGEEDRQEYYKYMENEVLREKLKEYLDHSYVERWIDYADVVMSDDLSDKNKIELQKVIDKYNEE